MRKTCVLLTALFVMICLLGGGCGSSASSQVCDKIKLSQEYLSDMNYEAAIDTLDEVLSINPKNEEAIKAMASGYMAWAESQAEENCKATALILLETGFEKTGQTALIEKMEQMEKGLEGVEKYWNLRRECINVDRVLSVSIKSSDLLDKVNSHCGLPYCAYYWTDQEKGSWWQSIEKLEKYRQFLLQNDLKMNREQWKERETLPSDADQYLDYYATCNCLQSLYLSVNEVEKSTQAWLEYISDENSAYEACDGGYQTKTEYAENDVMVHYYFDEAGRNSYLEHYQGGELCITIEYLVEENRMNKLIFKDRNYVEEKQCYYDESGRLEEVITYSSEEPSDCVRRDLQFSYCPDGIVRIDLSIEKLDTDAQEEAFYDVFQINEYGDLEKINLPEDQIPERAPRKEREADVAKRLEYSDEGGIEIDEVHFPDEYFRNYVKEKFDLNKNGLLSNKEIKGATSINFNVSDEWSFQNPIPCYSLKGVEYLSELKGLTCRFSLVEELDLKQNHKLKTVTFTCSPLKKIDVSGCELLSSLIVSQNRLVELDVSHNKELSNLECGFNKFEGVDISHNPKLN